VDDQSADSGADTSDTGGGADAVADADAADSGSASCEATGSDVEGPFHVEGAPERTVLAGPEEPGNRLLIEGTVYGPDCGDGLAGVLLDVWHADADGNYHDAADDYRLRGQMMTDADGRYSFETIIPGRYPLGGSTRPAHIHFMVSKPGFAPLTTQLYFAGDPFLKPNDPCGSGCNSGDPTLIIDLADRTDGEGAQGVFDIILEST
jgi:protocatechuate 3,4-dioxygenase beta subunit